MAEKKEKVGFFKGIAKRVSDVKSEMKKITWPTRSQVINNTMVVIAVSLVAAAIVFGLDTIFNFALRLVLRV